MPAQDVIFRKRRALTVDRPSGEEVFDGYARRIVTSVAGVLGHMQPMTDKELRYVPEGLNTLEWWNVWSLSEIREGDKVTDGTAPTVTIEKLKFWTEGTFWHGQGVRVTDFAMLPGGVGVALGPAPTGVGVGAHP